MEERKTNPDLEVPYFSGAAVLVRTSYAKTIGLFDTPFYMYHEDVDASFNARIHGYKAVVEPKSIVYHYYEFSRSIGKFYWMERNRIVTLLTYYKLMTLALIATPFFCVELVSFVMSLKTGWWQKKLSAWAFFLKPSSWKWIVERRRKAQRERLLTDREFLKTAVGEILFQEAPQTDSTKSGILTDVRGSIVSRLGNPILKNLWQVIYSLIRW
jgi:GT2 family glycosyltransferase